jgi:hypothetical protein
LTFGEWNAVHNWALKQGYQFGFGKGETEKHPVCTVTWYDAVKFCNAASELAGLTPVYYTNENKNQVYRVGELDLSDVCVKVEANGYRLPTEWEWEYACRAGSKTLYYYGETSIPGIENPYAWHTNNNGKGDNVSPHIVGLKKPNLFGLYDMSGNVAEWCWNLYTNYAFWRVQRGGSVALDNDVTSGFRSPVPPDYRIFDAGLRLASNSSACPKLTEIIASKGLSITINHQMLTPQYDGQNEQAVATKLVSLLSPNSPEVQKVIALHLSGKYKEALEAYRDVFAAHLRTAPAMKFRAPKAPREADKIAAWFTETENFATTAKNQFDNLDNLGRMQENSYHMPVTWDFGMGFNYYSELWFDVIRQLVVPLPVAEGYGSLPPRAVANMVIYAATDDISKLLKDPRNCVGNQQIEQAKVLVELSRQLPQFRDAAAWDKLGIDRLKNGALTRFILPDGGDLEQSFNYNAGLFRATTSIFELFEGQLTPDWVEKLKSMSICRTRMFGVLRLSSGTAPSVGNNAYGRDLPASKEDVIKENDPFFDALVEKINDQLIFKGKKGLSPPIFTSIALPYSGYYLMRNGWTNQSSSLFFKSSRAGAGHNHSDNNSIELCAYGRHLLVDREAPPYNVDHFRLMNERTFLGCWNIKGKRPVGQPIIF